MDDDEQDQKARQMLLDLDEGGTNIVDTTLDDFVGQWNEPLDGEEQERAERIEREREREQSLMKAEYEDLNKVYSKAVKRSFRSMRRFPEPAVGPMAQWTEEDGDLDQQQQQRLHLMSEDYAHETANDDDHQAPSGSHMPTLRYNLGVYDEHMFVDDRLGGHLDGGESENDGYDDDDTTATSATCNRRSYGYAECDYAEEEMDDGFRIVNPEQRHSSAIARIRARRESSTPPVSSTSIDITSPNEHGHACTPSNTSRAAVGSLGGPSLSRSCDGQNGFERPPSIRASNRTPPARIDFSKPPPVALHIARAVEPRPPQSSAGIPPPFGSGPNAKPYGQLPCLSGMQQQQHAAIAQRSGDRPSKFGQRRRHRSRRQSDGEEE